MRGVFENERTLSTREYAMFAPAQVLRKWREQRPSNQGEVHSSVTGGGWESLLHGGGQYNI